jgi:hypothetical protein
MKILFLFIAAIFFQSCIGEGTNPNGGLAAIGEPTSSSAQYVCNSNWSQNGGTAGGIGLCMIPSSSYQATQENDCASEGGVWEAGPCPTAYCVGSITFTSGSNTGGVADCYNTAGGTGYTSVAACQVDNCLSVTCTTSTTCQ